MLLTASIDFFIALSIQKTNNKKRKFILLLVSICSSLGLLIYFKYIHFIMENIYSIVKLEYNALNILIPLGISFYTFRTISYVIDVYREEIKPTTKYSEYIAYMSFFPLLIAGPITRAKNFIPQLRRNFNIKEEKIYKALFLIIIGLIKKAVIADYIGQYCNMVFDAPAGYSGFENLIAVYGFALQIYFDFS
ncbi:MAG TPA: MBOAT family protein, partial [Bacteroidales bacterium]|nr:MBOAT family protein [Bacteroidales bacterium]